MNTISAPEGDSVISQILAAYELPGTILDIARHGKGAHQRYLLRIVLAVPREAALSIDIAGLSPDRVSHPESDGEFVGITSYLKRFLPRRGPSRETLSLVRVSETALTVTDARQAWPLMPFIENADCYQSATCIHCCGVGTNVRAVQYMLGVIPPGRSMRPFPFPRHRKPLSVFLPRWKPIS